MQYLRLKIEYSLLQRKRSALKIEDLPSVQGLVLSKTKAVTFERRNIKNNGTY